MSVFLNLILHQTNFGHRNRTFFHLTISTQPYYYESLYNTLTKCINCSSKLIIGYYFHF